MEGLTRTDRSVYIHESSKPARHCEGELRRRHIDADVYVVEGDARSLVPQLAARIDAELVVVGTAHRPGSTPPITTAILRHAPCSVLVVDEGSAHVSAKSTLQTGAE